jgi:formiminoglutamase
MSIRQLRRLLVEPDQEALFRSNDPEDPRVGDLLISLEDADEWQGLACVIIGVPQHIGVERNGGRPGADRGPHHIRKALSKLATSAIVDSVQEKRLTLIDAGDIDPEGLTLEQIHDALHDAVRGLLEMGAFPIILGGGHDTAWPTIRAYETLGDSYGVINIDAHADVRPLKSESRAHSGSPFRQMLDVDDSVLTPGGFVEFGLQHHAVAAEHLRYVTSRGMHVEMLDAIRAEGFDVVWRRALEAAGKTGKLHVSLDMDGFSSAYAPGVSAPSADGFTPSEIGAALREAARMPSMTSFDVVELNPLYDVDERTAKLAATMIMNVLAGLADRR